MNAPTRPELLGDFGMVASTHWLASSIAMSVLERGGNAFDAAAAAGFALQMVEPDLCGPLGEVPIILWSERDQQVHVVCGQGVAPAAATPETFDALGLDSVPGSGLLAATVPGAFGAWMTMLERWGTWRVRDVLEHAIALGTNGVPVVPKLAETLAGIAQHFRTAWPTSAAAWLPKGDDVPAPGSRLRMPGMAATYERLTRSIEAPGRGRDGEIRAAVDVWYRGFVAEEVDRFCHDQAWLDTSGRAHTGLLDADDLARWSASVEAPASHDFGRYTVCKTGAWGQGPVMLQQLALLEAAGIHDVSPDSPEYLHLMIECAKLAFADREAWYGDSGGDPVPALLDPVYVAERVRLVHEHASLDLRPGSIGGRQPHLGRSHAVSDGPPQAGTGEPTLGRRGAVNGDTCHVDVVDRWGNMVSATPSGGWLQSSPTIPALGFCLGTRAQMFTMQADHPNVLRPGARPRTTLTPSLALRDGRPWLAFGTPGGDQQDQWNLAFFCSVVLGGLDLQAAIDSPMFTSLHTPDSFFPHTSRPGHLLMESRFEPATIAELERRGHRIELSDPWSLGRLTAVGRDHDGWLRAAANPRGAKGYAVGR